MERKNENLKMGVEGKYYELEEEVAGTRII